MKRDEETEAEEGRKGGWGDGGTTDELEGGRERERERESANAAHRSHRGNSVVATHTHSAGSLSIPVSCCRQTDRHTETEGKRENEKERGKGERKGGSKLKETGGEKGNQESISGHWNSSSDGQKHLSLSLSLSRYCRS